VSVGTYVACAIRTGNVYCWGYGKEGALGNGSRRNRSVATPVSSGGVLSGQRLVAVTAGSSRSCAIDARGVAYCWGQGPLGDGTRRDSLVPVRVRVPAAVGTAGFDRIQQGGNGPVCARTMTTHDWFCWGNPVLSGGSFTSKPALEPQPLQAPEPLRSQHPALFAYNTEGPLLDACAVADDGHILCWSGGDSGSTPVVGLPEPSTNRVVQLSVNQEASCAVLADGATWCWKDRLQPRQPSALGDGQEYWNGRLPVPYAAVRARVSAPATSVASAGWHVCAVTSVKKVECWGSGYNGELGDGRKSPNLAPRPISVPPSVRFTSVSTQLSLACALSSKGQVWCWGRNYNGELGRGSQVTESATPRPVRVS
jgi:alpha-tubulin suppressor-like RCC1 family protein